MPNLRYLPPHPLLRGRFINAERARFDGLREAPPERRMPLGDFAQGDLDPFGYIDPCSFSRRRRLARPSPQAHGPREFLREELDLVLELLDPARIIEGLRFRQFVLEVAEPLTVRCSGLRIKDFAGVGQSSKYVLSLRPTCRQTCGPPVLPPPARARASRHVGASAIARGNACPGYRECDRSYQRR